MWEGRQTFRLTRHNDNNDNDNDDNDNGSQFA